jgi:hypothetical protein
VPLEFAAGGLGQPARAYDDDSIGAQARPLRYGVLDLAGDFRCLLWDVGGGAFDHDDEGLGAGAGVWDGDRRYAAAAHAAEFGRGLLDNVRHVVASGDDDEIFDPAGHEEVAVGEKAEVTRAEPAVARIAGREPVGAEVAVGDRGAAEEELTLLVLGQVRAVGVADADAVPGQRAADGG